MKIAQLIPRWVLGTKEWFKAGQAVLVETVELTIPNMRGDSEAVVQQGEEVIAAAIAACVDKLEEDIVRGTAIVSIRHVVEKKHDVVAMTKLWREDQALHIRLAAEGAKPCATGFRQEHPHGFQMKILMQRAMKFAIHQFTETAKDWDFGGCIQNELMFLQLMAAQVNLEDVPNATKVGCGLDTIILNHESAGVDRTTLTVNCRGCPLMFLHQSDPTVEDPTSFSDTNPEQTRTVMDCLTLLRPWFTGTIRTQTGPSPVIIRPTAGDDHLIGRSRMNLMADVSNAREDTDSTTAAGEERTVSAVTHRTVHSIKNQQTLNSVIHQRSAEMDSSRLTTSQEQQQAADLSNNGNPADTFSSIPAERENEASKSAGLAKCDERRCPVTTTANDDRSSAKNQQQHMSSQQRLMNKNHPYLFAYINSPAAVSPKEEVVEVPPASDFNSGLVDVPQGELHSEHAETDGTWPMSVARDERHLMPAAIPPLATNLRIFRK
ncbi:hypothetical protein GPALN_004502 [Globodera pallida]|nr:hypothetical protein GPALN_004502 [Globodera pallida]